LLTAGNQAHGPGQSLDRYVVSPFGPSQSPDRYAVSPFGPGQPLDRYAVSPSGPGQPLDRYAVSPPPAAETRAQTRGFVSAVFSNPTIHTLKWKNAFDIIQMYIAAV